MAERNNNGSASSLVIISRKSFFCLFTFSSILFLLSWFFLLRSSARPQFINRRLLPNPHQNFVSENKEPSLSNQSIPRDNKVKEEEEEEITQKPGDVKCSSSGDLLKVFMYDLPPEFHFELLDWKSEGGSIWPDIRAKLPEYPGGLNLQHSIEYWLTLDLLASESTTPHTAIRVRNSSEADIIFVPFFSSLSYNRYSKTNPHQKKSRNILLQEKLVTHITAQPEWKKSGGRDHIVLAHHPNSMLHARMKLWPAIFILSDFGRYPPNIANVEKDVIAPYKHVVRSYVNDSSDFDRRQTLLYFQGAIYRKDGGYARQELFYLLKDEKDVHFSFGSVQKGGINSASQGMHSSKFCLNIAGDTPSSNRLFDAIASHCVPVIISDDIELPYEDVLDYSTFCLFVRTSDAIKKKYLINLVRSIGKDEWTRMWNKLKEVEKFFEFCYPSKENDAVQMIWQAVARKVPSVKMKIHRARRYSPINKSVKEDRVSGSRAFPSPNNFW